MMNGTCGFESAKRFSRQARKPCLRTAAGCFRQLHHAETGTHTYLIADSRCRKAALIDPVLEDVSLYLELLRELDVSLVLVLDTHLHSDHVTAAAALRSAAGARIAVGANGEASGADIYLADGQILCFGGETVQVIAAPGHTPGCACFLWRDRLFTGDSLMIGSCGRTDLPGGDAGRLYDSVKGKLMTLPSEFLVYPGHDYGGRFVSCIGQERSGNALLGAMSRDEFVSRMAHLAAPVPSLGAALIEANRRCGDLPPSPGDARLQHGTAAENGLSPPRHRPLVQAASPSNSIAALAYE
jgi:sulfur dioxygenase